MDDMQTGCVFACGSVPACFEQETTNFIYLFMADYNLFFCVKQTENFSRSFFLQSGWKVLLLFSVYVSGSSVSKLAAVLFGCYKCLLGLSGTGLKNHL